MNNNIREIYSEVYIVLNKLGDNFISKLPYDLYNMIKEEKLDNNKAISNKTISLDKQNLKRETLSIIALLHLNYWCNSEEEKNRLRELFSLNEEKYQLEIRKKYNSYDIFKNNKKIINGNTIEKETSMVKYKESILRRIIKKIKDFLFHIKF